MPEIRRKIIAGNWKMNMLISEAINLANGLKRELLDIDTVDVVLCPPFTALGEVAEIIAGTNLRLGAQNLFWEKKGAYTGEIAPAMLKDVGCAYVVLGHSERRKYFKETNDDINKKVKAALLEGLLPIVCVGETLEQRKAEKTFAVVQDHVENSLKGLSEEEILKTTIAYEPVWAIGTGVNATPEQAQEVHQFIRKLLSKIYSEEVASQIRIQYGGSVTAENASSLLQQPDVDGALVGGASLKIDSFAQIVKSCL
jgi:triosephosphate isomerase